MHLSMVSAGGRPLAHDHGLGTVHSRLTWPIICGWMGHQDGLLSDAGSVSPQKHSLRTAACRLHA